MNELSPSKMEDVARNLLEMERKMNIHNYPEPITVLVTWKGHTYIGTIQVIRPDFSKEIVFLSKSSFPIDDRLAEAIRKIDKGRLELVANDFLNLIGRYHTVRRVENKLTVLTSEQTAHIIENPFELKEVDIKKYWR